MDIEILLWFQGIREAIGPFLETCVSWLSDIMAYSIAVLPFIYYWCEDKKRGRIMILALSISMYLNQLLKVTFSVYRPWVRDSRITPCDAAMKSASGYSFPSGHTQVAGTAYGSVYMFERKKRKKAAVLCAVLLVLTALSRVFLGVHTPQDVLAALLIACVSIAQGMYLGQKEEKPHRFTVLLFAALTAAGIAWAFLRQYPADYADGVLIVDPAGMIKDAMMNIGIFFGAMSGMYLEKTRLNFSTEGTPAEKKKRFIQGVPGIVIFILLYKLLPEGSGLIPPAAFVSGALAAFYAVYLYPWYFTKQKEKDHSSGVPEE